MLSHRCASSARSADHGGSPGNGGLPLTAGGGPVAASIRRNVGADTGERIANSIWPIPSRARAAAIWRDQLRDSVVVSVADSEVAPHPEAETNR
jgi:hypothetical protein